MASILQRRDFIRFGIAGVTATHLGTLPVDAAVAPKTPQGRGNSFGRARSVIVMYSWGGMSHLDTFDMKPDAGSEIRGEFNPVSTSVPGIRITEHLPMIGKLMQHLAVVRSVHHESADHRKAAYWNLTGHAPVGGGGGVALPVLPTRKDWPSIGAQVAIAMRNDRRYQNRNGRFGRQFAANHQHSLSARRSWASQRAVRRVSRLAVRSGVRSSGTRNGVQGNLTEFRHRRSVASRSHKAPHGPA